MHDYKRRASRPFLTLYFIPCLPLGGITEYLECQNCKGAFSPEWLFEEKPHQGDGPPVSIPFEVDLARAIAVIICEDQAVEEIEISSALSVYTKLTNMRLTRDELGAYCGEVQAMRLTTINFLLQTSRRWNIDQKRIVLQAMFIVASATGELGGRRLYSLEKSLPILQMTEEEYRSAIEQAMGWELNVSPY